MIGTKALEDWLCCMQHNASESGIMKHMLLNGLRVCTERIKSRSQVHLKSEKTLHLTVLGYKLHVCVSSHVFVFKCHLHTELQQTHDGVHRKFMNHWGCHLHSKDV